MISKEIKEQQNKIINSSRDKIVVFAGPGSGKTFTLVNKIIKDSESLERGIIAISFTKEASKQLEKKIDSKIKNKKEISFIGTIDSFAVNLINIGYQHVENEKKINFEIDYPNSMLETKFIKKGVSDNSWKDYCKKWLAELHNGKLTLSFVMYVYCLKILKNDIMVQYLKFTYEKIYIDEAQDLNRWQSDFFKKLIEVLDLKAMYVGDNNQNIYQFRGADSSFFLNLVNEGYQSYEITETVRCPNDIIKFSNAYVNCKKIKISNFKEIIYNEKLDFDKIKKTSNNVFLASTRIECNNILEKMKKNNVNNCFFTEGIDLSSYPVKIQSIIELSLFYIVNLIEGRLIISNNKYLKEVAEELMALDNKINKNHIEILHSLKDINDYDCMMENFLKIIYNEKFNIEIQNKLLETKYFKHYNLSEDINKIMTIHQSKGLEYDNVYVKISKDFLKNNIETRNKYYVAFTRVKKKLYISANDNIVKKIKNIYE